MEKNGKLYKVTAEVEFMIFVPEGERPEDIGQDVLTSPDFQGSMELEEADLFCREATQADLGVVYGLTCPWNTNGTKSCNSIFKDGKASL